jgi:uncharacterized membrane protein
MKKDNTIQNPELMSKDPENWRGIFYFNKKDSRLIVPKLNPVFGWTFNFGSLKAILIIVAIIVSVIMVAIMTR